MWKSLTGRSTGRSEQSDHQGTSNGKRSSRSRAGSIPTSSSSRKSSKPEGKRDYDLETSLNSSASQNPRAVSVSSSYATADTHTKSARQSDDTYGIGNVPSRYSQSKYESADGSERRSHQGRRDRSTSRERKQSTVSSGDGRGHDSRERREATTKGKESSQDYGRKGSEPGLMEKSRTSRSSKPSRAATMPARPRGVEDYDTRPQNQFSDQLTSSFDHSYRPPGLASDYYGDHGESVGDQPGVRPVAPSIILGPDTHLQEASAVAAPPVEPSAVGQVGAAASFYANQSDQENAQQNHTNGMPSKPSASVPFGLPSPRASPGPTPLPGTFNPTTSGLNTSYYFAEPTGGVDQAGQSQYSYGLGTSDPVQQSQSQRPSRPTEKPSLGSNATWTAAGAAAGAYGLYNHHHSQGHYDEHHSPLQNFVYASPQGGDSHLSLLNQKHRHRGPLSKLVDFFKDPEGVGQYEAYTEYLGVCKYCFDPGSSPRDAPRKHHYKRRLSGGGRHGSSTRVDKLNRYASSEDEKRKKHRSKAPMIAAGIAGYGLAQAGKSLANRKDFDDTYSVQSGRPVDGEARHSKRDRDHDYARKRNGRDQTRYGITHANAHINSSSSTERRAPRSNGYSLEQDHADNHQYAKHKPPHGSTSARRSPKSSYVSLVDDGPSGYSSFFNAPSANQRSHRKKKRKGFFTFNNSSSSSSDADLAFGTGRVRRKDSKRSNRSRRDDFDLNATVLGLGAATAALAAADSRQSRNRRHGADLVAVKDKKAEDRRRKRSEQRYRRDSGSSKSGPESGWEDASDVDSGADSALAYGLAARRSRESLASNESGTEKWAWRWGSNKPNTPVRDPRSRQSHDFQIPLAPVQHHMYAQSQPPEKPSESVVSLSSLQQVYPVPTSDPNMFDVARKSSNTSTQPRNSNAPYISQTASVPLKQPQPITPATTVLNGDHSSDLGPLRRSSKNNEKPKQASRTSKPSQFLPNEIMSESPPQANSTESQGSQTINKRVSWSVADPRQAQSANIFSTDKQPQFNESSTSSRQKPPQARSSGVTFDLPEKELEREQRAERRRAERRHTDSNKRDHGYYEEDLPPHPRRRSHSSEDELDQKMTSDSSSKAPRRKSEENIAREEELEREIRQLVEEDQSRHGSSENRPSLSRVGPAAIGAAGAGFAAAAIHAMSTAGDGGREHRKADESEKEFSGSSSDIYSQQNDDGESGPGRRKRRSGKVTLPRSISSPVHDNYGSYFTPPELAKHVQEHNIASERRNSMEDRTKVTPQIVEVVPASPLKFPLEFYEPFGSRAEHNAERLFQPIPRLSLMEPSPPASIAGSVRGDATPTIIAVEPADMVPDELVESPSSTKENEDVQTHHMDTLQDEKGLPFVDRAKKPRNHVGSPAVHPISDEPLSPKTRPMAETEEVPHQSPDKDYDIDLAFAAALAAGAQGAGFDPSIVIDDPTYHRRDSPPGSEEAKTYRAPFAETVSDLGVEGQTSPIPAQIGFVEGEVDSPIAEHETVAEGSKSFEQETQKRLLQASDEHHTDGLADAQDSELPSGKNDTSRPKIPGDFNVFDYIEDDSPARKGEHKNEPYPVDSMSADEVLSRVSWSSPKAVKDDVQDETNAEDLDGQANDQYMSDQQGRRNEDQKETKEPTARDNGQEELDDFYKLPATKKSKKKSKRESVARDKNLEFADVVDEASRSRRKDKRENGSVEDDISVAASAPATDFFDDSVRTKKKSKKDRRSAKTHGDVAEDMESTVSSPAKISSEKDFSRSSKDKGSGGILSMFSAVQALSAQKDSKAVDEATRTNREDESDPGGFETPKKKSKKKSKKDKSRESTLDWDEVYEVDQSQESQTPPKNEADSFLGERPEMPLKLDTGASGQFPFNLDPEQAGQLSSTAVSEDYVSKPDIRIRSRSVSPPPTERSVELPPISFSRSNSPTTPQTRDTLRERRLSALQIGQSVSDSLANSSPTAIPLSFRRPQVSPSHTRHGSASSPATESPSAPQGIVRSRQPRPNSTEFKSSKEFRPLFLVERHSYKHEPEVTETYPSLPSSRTSSAHPSMEDLRNAQQEEDSLREPPDWFGQPPKGDKRRSWSSFRPESPQYLDSQQTTPTATEFSTELKRPKPKYEFHSPSELLQDLSMSHEEEKGPISPIALPESLNTESLDDSGHPVVDRAESSRSLNQDAYRPSEYTASQENDADTLKAVGLATTVGLAGVAVAAASPRPESVIASVERGEKDLSLAPDPRESEGDQETGASPDIFSSALAGPQEGAILDTVALQGSSKTASKQEKKKSRKSVGFADGANDPNLIPDAAALQEAASSNCSREAPAAADTRGPPSDNGEESSAPDKQLSWNPNDILALQEATPTTESVPEVNIEASSHESPVNSEPSARGPSPHVHWPEGSLTVESVEYDPYRSTQHLADEGNLAKKEISRGVQPEDGDGEAQTIDLAPEATPLPVTDDSDLLELQTFEGTAADDSPLSVAFERAKAVRGLPVSSDDQFEEGGPRRGSSEYQDEHEKTATEPATDTLPTRPPVESTGYASAAPKPGTSSTTEHGKADLFDRSDSPSPKSSKPDKTEEPERQTDSAFTEPVKFSTVATESAVDKTAELPDLLRPGADSSTQETVDIEPATSAQQGEAIIEPIESERRSGEDAQKPLAGPVNPTIEETPDDPAAYEPEEPLWPISGRKDKKKKSKGRSSILPSGPNASESERMDQGLTQQTDLGSRNIISQGPDLQEEAPLIENEQTTEAAAASLSQEKLEDVVDWAPAVKKGKKGRKAKDKQRAGSFLSEPVASHPHQPSKGFDPPIELVQSEPSPKEAQALKFSIPSGNHQEETSIEESAQPANQEDSNRVLLEDPTSQQREILLTTTQSITQPPEDLPPEKAKLIQPVEEQANVEAIPPPPSSRHQPVEEIDWTLTTKSKKGKKKKQPIRPDPDTLSTTEASEEVKGNISKELSSAPQFQSSPSRKQSKKDKKRKKATTSWDVEENASTNASQPVDAVGFGPDLTPSESDQLITEDFTAKNDALDSLQTKYLDSKANLTEAEASTQVVQQHTDKHSPEHALTEDALEPEPASSGLHRDILKDTDAEDVEPSALTGETSLRDQGGDGSDIPSHGTTTLVLGDSGLAEESLAHGSAETRLFVEDEGTAWTTPSKKDKKGKKSKKGKKDKQATAQTTGHVPDISEERDRAGGNVLSPNGSFRDGPTYEPHDTTGHNHRTTHLESEEPATEEPETTQPSEADRLAEPRPEIAQHIDLTRPKIGLTPEELQDLPPETPQEERSESSLWNTAAVLAASENGYENIDVPQNITATPDETVLDAAGKPATLDETTVSDSADPNRYPDEIYDMENAKQTVESPSGVEGKASVANDHQPMVEGLPISQYSPNSNVLDSSKDLQREHSLQMTSVGLETDTSPAPKIEPQEEYKKAPEPETSGREQKAFTSDDTALRLRETSEKFLLPISEPAKQGSRPSTAAPSECPGEKTLEPVPELGTMSAALEEQDVRRGETIADGPEGNDSTEPPKKRKKGKKKNEFSLLDEAVQVPSSGDTIDPLGESQEFARGNKDVQEQREKPGNEAHPNPPATQDTNDELKKELPKNLQSIVSLEGSLGASHLAEDIATEEIDGGAEAHLGREGPKIVVSHDVQAEKDSGCDDLVTKELKELADNDIAEGAETQPEAQPLDFSWSKPSKKERKKKKGKFTTEAVEPETKLEREEYSDEKTSQAKDDVLPATEFNTPDIFQEPVSKQAGLEVTALPVEHPSEPQPSKTPANTSLEKDEKRGKFFSSEEDPSNTRVEGQRHSLSDVGDGYRVPKKELSGEVEPDEFSWNYSTKKGKKQKKKGQSKSDTTTLGEERLNNDESQLERQTGAASSILDHPRELPSSNVIDTQSKKGKKSKKKARMPEDESIEPAVSKNVEPGQDVNKASEPSILEFAGDQNSSALKQIPVEDDWATTGKKNNKGKNKKKTRGFENDLDEPPKAKDETKHLEDQPVPQQTETEGAHFLPPPNGDLEMTEEHVEQPTADNEMALDDNTKRNASQITSEARKVVEDRTEVPISNVGEDLSETTNLPPFSSGQDVATTAEAEPENPSWLAPVARKRSKKDKNKGKGTESVPVPIQATEPDDFGQEAQKAMKADEQMLPTLLEDPLASNTYVAGIQPDQGLTGDLAQSEVQDSTTQSIVPADVAENSMRDTTDFTSQESVPKAVAKVLSEESNQKVKPVRSDFTHVESKESLSAVQNIPKGYIVLPEPESAHTAMNNKDMAGKEGKTDKRNLILLKDKPALSTDMSTHPWEIREATEREQESFRPARHVEPSIQKAIETLGATQRPTILQRRLSSPSDVRPFRDSAMQMLDSPHVADLMQQPSRDSGYIPSPVIPREVLDPHDEVPKESTRNRPPRPITPTSSSEDLKIETKQSIASARSRSISLESEGRRPGMHIDVELSPDYEFTVRRGSADAPGSEEHQPTLSPSLSPKTSPVETVKGFPETPVHRRPSQIDSTSKDRSSALFDSSPSVRTPDLGHAPQSNREVKHDSVSGLHRSPSVHSRRSAELLKQQHEDETRAPTPGVSESDNGRQSPTPQKVRSIFGGPVESELPHSHQKGSSPPRKPLGTIPEDISPSYLANRGSQGDSGDVNSSKGIARSLLSQEPRSELDEEREAVSSSPRPSSKPIGGDLPATPEESEDEGARDSRPAQKGAKGLGNRPSFPTSRELQDANANANNSTATASSSTHDPITGRANEAARDMAGVYDGWGASAGSPMSPTRPPSMRKRQSMQQIQDLEAKVEQLASENRLLATAKVTAEKNLEDFHFSQSRNEYASQEALEAREVKIREQDSEIHNLKENLEWIHREVSRLKELNDGLTATNVALTASAATHEQTVTDLRNGHGYAQEQWQNSSRELKDLRAQHNQLSSGMEGIVRHEIEIAVADRDVEIKRLSGDLEMAKIKIRELQQQLLARRSDDQFTPKDADYFENACQQLCHHVQGWVKRYSKYSDTRACRLTSEVRDEQIVERFENAMLDDYDVNKYLTDRVKRRDVFMSVVMWMIWNHVFTRYLFGMDREQRQKLKSLEKNLSDIGPPSAVRRWRSLTLTLLTQRESFKEQRAADTEAVVLDIYRTLTKFLPPPAHVEGQLLDSLRSVMRVAVDLSIEMRKQRAEYTVLPPLQPEYDTNGDLAHFVYFNAALMNERSGETTSNEALEAEQAIVRIVLFPLVVMKGGENGEGDEEDVVCPAQVLIAKQGKDKKVVRIQSGEKMSLDGANRSVHSIAPSSMDMGNVI